MAARRFAKRASFYLRAKRLRTAAAISLRCSARPGFLGVVSNVRVNGEPVGGMGALYLLSGGGSN